jgi:hypothetical protein
VRPEAVILGEGTLKASIEDVEPHGRETIYHLATPLGPLRALEAGNRRRAVGDALPVTLGDVLLFDATSGRRIDNPDLRLAA